MSKNRFGMGFVPKSIVINFKTQAKGRDKYEDYGKKSDIKKSGH